MAVIVIARSLAFGAIICPVVRTDPRTFVFLPSGAWQQPLLAFWLSCYSFQPSVSQHVLHASPPPAKSCKVTFHKVLFNMSLDVWSQPLDESVSEMGLPHSHRDVTTSICSGSGQSTVDIMNLCS